MEFDVRFDRRDLIRSLIEMLLNHKNMLGLERGYGGGGMDLAVENVR